MSKLNFETENLLVNNLTVDDALMIAEFLEDRSSLKFSLYSSMQHSPIRFIEEQLLMYKKYNYGWWGITEKKTGQLVGCGGLNHQTIYNTMLIEIGYILSSLYWGRGLGSEILTGTLKYTKDNLITPSVIALLDPENQATNATAKRVGMQYTFPIEIGSHRLTIFQKRLFIIQINELIIRELTEDDAAELHKLFPGFGNLKDASPFTLSLKEKRSLIEKQLGYYKSFNYGIWGVEKKSELIGIAGAIPDNKESELVFHFSSKNSDNMDALESLRAICKHLFANFYLTKIYAKTSRDNKKTLSLFEKLYMRQTLTLSHRKEAYYALYNTHPRKN